MNIAAPIRDQLRPKPVELWEYKNIVERIQAILYLDMDGLGEF